MRGSPLLNALMAFFAIALMGWPIHRLTHVRASVPAPGAPPKSSQQREVPVSLTFTAIPEAVRIRHLGKVVWTMAEPALSDEAKLSLPWPEEGVDLLVEIDWPESTPATAAARVVLIDSQGEEQMRSVWRSAAETKTTEVLAFH
jgi:hypothetical protein